MPRAEPNTATNFFIAANSSNANTVCYILRATVTDTSTGEEKFEEVLLQAK